MGSSNIRINREVTRKGDFNPLNSLDDLMTLTQNCKSRQSKVID